MSETDTAALRVLADNIKHAPHIWAHDAVKPLRTAADTIDALRAEASAASSMARVLANEYARAERAEGTIAAAPHTADCGVRESRNGDPAPRPCTCWKAEYARASQPAPSPVRIEDMTPGTTFSGRGAPDGPWHRFMRVGRPDSIVAIDERDAPWRLKDFDPSTIRDVQPAPTEGDAS